MSAQASALFSVVIVSLLPFIASVGLLLRPRTLDKIRIYLISFAAGALFGDAFIHLLPEIYRRLGPGLPTALWCIAGVYMFFVLDQLIRHRSSRTKSHDRSFFVSPLVTITLTGGSLHNFLDGLLIGASYLAGPVIGLSTTFAIILHEIPHELGDIGVLMHGGLPLKRAIKVNFLFGLAAVLGTALVVAAGTTMTTFAQHLLPVGAGGFLYLAGSVLVPELLKETTPRKAVLHLLSLSAGVGAMATLVLIE